MPPVKSKSESIDILRIEQESSTYLVLGTTPFIANRMSEKAKHELLLPKGRKNAAERATTLKHNPLEEFAASPYTFRDPAAPTFIAGLAVWFKKAMMTAALDLPGTNKSQIARNLRVEGERLPLYGIPELLMSVTRSADINKTPDIRSRVIVPRWAMQITVTYTVPLLKGQQVSNLLAAAGMTVGVGDWRLEKGSGDYGLFRLATEDDPVYRELIATGGRAAQLEAMQAAAPYDDETSDLFAWFDSELSARRLRGVA